MDVNLNAFAPDVVLPKSEAPKVTPLQDTGAAAPGAAAGEAVTSFKDTVKNLLGDVNDKITTSDQNVRDLAMGKTNDLNKVVTSVEEANLALQYTIAMRQKLLEAYQEISRIQV